MDWLTREFTEHASQAGGSFVMASHIPMHVGAFTPEHMDELKNLLGQSPSTVYGNFAGHMHFTYDTPVAEGLYTVHVTDATYDDELTLRLVNVKSSAEGYAYEHELLEIPW